MVITFKELGNYGRFGNQMFQYALLLGVSTIKKYDIKIPNGNYDLLKLNVKKNFLDKNEIINNNFSEKFYHYDGDVFSVSDNTNFRGYFQSYKYFQHAGYLVREYIKCDDKVEEEAQENIYKCIDGNSTCIGIVGIHVRRKDYITLPQHHPVCSIEYYRKSIEYFTSLGNYSFIVVSDDMDWCKKNIVGSNIFYADSNYDKFIDLAIMYKSDHNIIANSSFSWWGAWLNSNPNKIVIYPSVWFGPKCPQDWQDLVPTEWVKI